MRLTKSPPRALKKNIERIFVKLSKNKKNIQGIENKKNIKIKKCPSTEINE